MSPGAGIIMDLENARTLPKLNDKFVTLVICNKSFILNSGITATTLDAQISDK